MEKDFLEARLHPFRGWVVLVMLLAILINFFSLTDRLDVFGTALLGHLLFGQAVVCYLFGWSISLGVGTMAGGRGRDLMGACMLAGFILMFFFRGY